MDLKISVSLIESGKSKRTVIISEIRKRSAYPSKVMKDKTNKRLRSWWYHRIRDRWAICGDKIREELSGKVANVKEYSTSLR